MRRSICPVSILVNRIARVVMFAALITVASGARAQQPSIQALGPGIWVAGIPSNEFEYFAAPQTDGHQRQSNWCWPRVCRWC